MTASSLPQSNLPQNPSLQPDSGGRLVPGNPGSPPPDPMPEKKRRFCLTQREWEALEDVAMSLHGVMCLIEEYGFDNSTGAQELFVLVYRRYEKLLSEIRSRLEREGQL